MKQMKCERCQKPATVYYRENVNGKEREMHLCADCAAKAGIGADAFRLPGFSDEDFFGTLPLFSNFLARPAADRSEKCPLCGKSEREIREDGKFGCESCYETFGKRFDLTPFIGRGYRGGAVGKAKVAAHEATPAERITALKAELKTALKDEAYEKAAELRDEIRRLEA